MADEEIRKVHPIKKWMLKNNIKPHIFAGLVQSSPASVFFWLSYKKIPSQRTAERIEKITLGEVKVKDLRGKDKRELLQKAQKKLKRKYIYADKPISLDKVREKINKKQKKERENESSKTRP